MKIVILGYSGAGKSTFANKLHKHYQIPALYLDTVHFEANWIERADADMEKDMLDFAKQDSWILEGNYRRLFTQRYDIADQIFIFKMNRFLCLYHVIARRIKYRNTQRYSMADGCREKIDFSFFMWVILNGRTKKRKAFFHRIEKEQFEKTKVFKNRRQMKQYLKEINYKDA
jgi:adenylate kinase family enzyme